MSGINFEWDPKKESSNREKHGVSFGEAMSVFWDEQALLMEDQADAFVEERLILLGYSSRFRVLVVVHTLRTKGSSIRIISARPATKREQSQYQNRLK